MATTFLEPIVPKDRKDIGKRLILAPTRFNPKIFDDELIDFLSNYPKEGVNTVVLVPSEFRSKKWVSKGAKYVNRKNIENLGLLSEMFFNNDDLSMKPLAVQNDGKEKKTDEII